MLGNVVLEIRKGLRSILMSNKGRSNAAKRRRHARAMSKRKAEKDLRKAEYERRIVLGTNSKRKKIAVARGRDKLVKDVKASTYDQYVPPSKYGEAFWQ